MTVEVVVFTKRFPAHHTVYDVDAGDGGGVELDRIPFVKEEHCAALRIVGQIILQTLVDEGERIFEQKGICAVF